MHSLQAMTISEQQNSKLPHYNNTYVYISQQLGIVYRTKVAKRSKKSAPKRIDFLNQDFLKLGYIIETSQLQFKINSNFSAE